MNRYLETFLIAATPGAALGLVLVAYGLIRYELTPRVADRLLMRRARKAAAPTSVAYDVCASYEHTNGSHYERGALIASYRSRWRARLCVWMAPTERHIVVRFSYGESK